MALIDDVLDEEINAKDLLVDELRPNTLEHWIDLLNDHMPRHIHTTVLTDTDVTNGHRLAYPVVWADRHYDTLMRPGFCAGSDSRKDAERGGTEEVQR